ncbi:DNA polymerase III subunit gamma/tau [Bifidobacterium sp. B4081]|uniref:DNA polymerase III subunit gamma/tau n=1 Tax=unclassified Bifidobacterium TaxID=2608897 RepID=UPI00226A94C0|nr:MULTISPECIES: DNA polymerase III subunit gamma/tau [unclassified Bifidobacterium]MCX8644006.1 DNA polymerase III subunit gamma/tau [Bifidobacterium sp. B4077]MCX8645094.1 DNA polymerase III subunit gamma/tau [Bifidobacterium sp. B4081]MCX8669196.1 DNA polymerase III subunit gamma/tau [Bifidobacterium sp. B3998]
MALALYRRYRPDTFDGIIGQKQVTVPLTRALDENRLTHAYLFSGPRGCGKTSSARIFARCVNCAKGPTSHPCGECDSCRDLATGGPGSIDVVEIDAASHNGVDDARELRERAGFAPVRDRYKIFILDEAHMVTQQGFNALLKIVEEPPEHVMFIFATTEPEKVIGTIRSRTHHYPFRLVPQEVMGPYLEGICKKEDIKAEPGVLKLAMRAGGGSVRDTLSVLDQLMVGADEHTITYDAAVALLGFTPAALIGEAVDTLINHDGAGLYGVIQKVVVGGFEPQRFVEDLLAHVRDLLVLKLAGERAESVLSEDADDDQVADLRRQADALDLQVLTRMADIINDALAGMNGATSPRMRLELLAARLLAIGCEPMEQATVAGGTSTSGVAPAPARSGFIGADRSQQNGRPPKASQSGRADGAVRPEQSGGAGSSSAAASATSAGSRNMAGSHSDSPAEGKQEGEGQPDHSGSAQPVRKEVPSSPAQQPVAQHDTSRGQETEVPTGTELDKRWDALVAALPDEVRQYVVRDRVPTVAMKADPSGRKRLSMTFDRPLSQHAFAMAVAAQSVDGETKVPRIVMVRARQEFGQSTMIAPSGTAANGETVESVNRMSPQRRAEVKKEVALARAGLATMNLGAAVMPHAATEQGHAPRKMTASAGHEGGAGASASEGRSTSGEAAGDGNSDDAHHPVGGPVQSSPEALPSAGFGSTASTVLPDDDPWAHPMPATHAPQKVWQPGEGSDGSNGQKDHESKKVALPDMSDDTDPWAVPDSGTSAAASAVSSDSQSHEVSPSVDSSGQGSASSATSDPTSGTGAVSDEGVMATGISASSDAQSDVHSSESVGGSDGPQAMAKAAGAESRRVPAGFAGPSSSGSDQDGASPAAVSSQAARPSVDPEDDVYSMDDARLGADNAMNQDELTKLFDVTKVEDFAADDPQNPINVQKRRQEQAQRQGGE